MTGEDEFWQSAIGCWLGDLASGEAPLVPPSTWRQPQKRGLPLQYCELTDGVLLTLLFHQIDESSEDELQVDEPLAFRDTFGKQRQLLALLEAIRFFYKRRLHQLVVLAPPDVAAIVRSLRPVDSSDELNKFLILLLGCAVQCEKKQGFIERITRLCERTQKGLAQHIQKITEGSSVVLSLNSTSETEVMFHLERTMKERDSLVQQMMHITQDHESDEGSSNTAGSSLNGDASHVHRKSNEYHYDRRSPSPTTIDRHSSVELASVRAEMRKLRNLYDEKEEEVMILRDELELKEAEILRVQEERLNLVKDARAAKDLRDELDCMQHRIKKQDKLEQENSKLRDKLSEGDFYKSRTEQLLGENDNLSRTVAILEDEMESLRQRMRDQQAIEHRFEESQNTVRCLQSDIGEKNSKIEQLLLDQSRLENELYIRNACLGPDREDDGSPRQGLGSLAEQLEQSERSEVAELRLEIKKLRSKLVEQEEKKPSGEIAVISSELQQEIENKGREIAELKEENEVVTKQLHHLEQTLSAINGQYKEAQEELDSLRNERDDATKSLHDARRKFAQFQSDLGKKFENEIENRAREFEVEHAEAKRKLQSAEEEKKETEQQLTRLREEQKRIRVTVDELKEEKHQGELQIAQLERSLKSAELEKNTLKEKSERLENELETARMRILTTEDAAKRLEASEKMLVEQTARAGEAEAESRSLQQQLELEIKKTQRLREDLVCEKTKGADLVSRLRSLCSGISLNGGKIDANMEENQLVESIDDVVMGVLNAAKREADAARLQQHTQLAELADLRRDIEKLRRSESASLVESDDRIREMSKENVNMKEQVFLLQEKVRDLQIEVSSKSSEVTVARREIEELHRNANTATASNTELARLQVSLRNLQLQEEIFKQDNAELRSQLDLAENSRYSAKKDADSLAVMHQTLLSDHDRLQNLHDLLTQDYERTKGENQDLKMRLRNSRPPAVVMPTRELEDMRTSLAQERSLRDNQMRAFADLQNEHGAAKRELDIMRKENENLIRSCDGMSAEMRALKLADQAHRTTIRELSASADELNRTLQQRQIDIERLQSKIEMLAQLNRNFEEENKNLARQIEMLLNQNKDLLNRALNDKEHHHQEQKDFQERLSERRRHIEKLEEKIMEQYKSMENKRVVDKTKQPLVKRAAKALISRRRPSQPLSNGGSTTEDSSTYSADESPMQINGERPYISSPMPLCPVHGAKKFSSLRLPAFKKRAQLPFDDPLGPYDNPQVDKMIDMAASIYENSGHDEIDLFPPTCSSSEDQDRASPSYETIISFKDPRFERPSPFRSRNDVIGGSVRVYPTSQRPLPQNGYPRPTFNEQGVDVPSYLPPRAPVRNTSATASLRTRPPPPPYNKSSATPTPSSLTMSPIRQFAPQSTSTPINGSPLRENDRPPAVAEGEKRLFIRDKDERVDKAMSIYENVNDPAEVRTQESTVWYEYGCV